MNGPVPLCLLLQAVARHLLRPSFTSGTFWLLVAAGAVRNIAGYALGAWLPTFFVVQYCVSSADYGLKAGLVVLFGGTTGAFLGGFLADRWGGLVHSAQTSNEMWSCNCSCPAGCPDAFKIAKHL